MSIETIEEALAPGNRRHGRKGRASCVQGSSSTKRPARRQRICAPCPTDRNPVSSHEPLPDGSILADMGARVDTCLPWKASGTDVHQADGQVIGRFDRACDAVYVAHVAGRYHRVLPDLLRGRCLERAFDAWTSGTLDALLRTVPTAVWRDWLRQNGWVRHGPHVPWFPRGRENGDLLVEDGGGAEYLIAEEILDIARHAGTHPVRIVAGMLVMKLTREARDAHREA
jgi:hypothetical protein